MQQPSLVNESTHTLMVDAPAFVGPGQEFQATATFENRTPRRSGKMSVAWICDGSVSLVSAERVDGTLGKNGSIGTLAPGEVVTVRATFAAADRAESGSEIAVQAVLAAGEKKLGSNIGRRVIESAPLLAGGELVLRPVEGDVELLVGIGNAGKATAGDVVYRLALSENVSVLECERSVDDATGETWYPDSALVTQPSQNELHVSLGDVTPSGVSKARIRLGVVAKAHSGTLALRRMTIASSNGHYAVPVECELAELVPTPMLEAAAAGVSFGLGDLAPSTLSIGSGRSGSVVPIEIIVPNVGTAPVRDVVVILDLPREIELAKNALRVTGASWRPSRNGVTIEEIAAGEKATVEGLVTLHSQNAVDVTASVAIGDVTCKTSVSIAASALLETPRILGVPARVEAGSSVPCELVLRNTGSAPTASLEVEVESTIGGITPSSKAIASIAPSTTVRVPMMLRVLESLHDAELAGRISVTVSGAEQPLLAAAECTVYGVAALEVVVPAMAAPASPAKPGTLVISIRNRGSAAARDVVVAADVPDGVGPISSVAIATIAAGDDAEVEVPIVLEHEVPDRILRLAISSANAQTKHVAARVATTARAEIEATLETELVGEEIAATLAIKNAGDGSARIVIAPEVPACVTLVNGSLRVNGRVVRDAYAFQRGIVIERAGPGEEHDVSWVALVDASSANGKLTLAARVSYDGRDQVVLGTALRYEGADVFDVFAVDETPAPVKAMKKRDVVAAAVAAPTPVATSTEVSKVADVGACAAPVDDIVPEPVQVAAGAPEPEAVVAAVAPPAVEVAAEGEDSVAARAAAEWLASLSNEWACADGILRLTGQRLQQIHGLLLHGRGSSYVTHLCAIGSLLPEEVSGAEFTSLDTVRQQLDFLLVRMQVGKIGDPFESDASRAELVTFLERAQEARGRCDERMGTIVTSVSKREIAEDLEHLRHAPYGSIFVARALARWIPTSIDDAELAAALALYKSTLLEELEAIEDTDAWWSTSAAPALSAHLERVRDAIDSAYQVER